MPIADWRLIFAIGGVIPLLLLTPLLFLLLPESPRFLVRAGRPGTQIAATLQRLCGSAQPLLSDATYVLNTTVSGTTESASFADKARAHARAVGTLSLMALLLYFASIGMSSMSTTILTSLGLPLTVAVSVLLALNLGGLAGALLAAFTIERLGSRPTLLALLGCAIACLAILAFMASVNDVDNVPLMTALYALSGFGLTSSLMIFYPLAAQAFPTEVRSTLTGGVSSVGRIGSIASSAVIAMLLTAGGAASAFAGMALAAGLAIVGVLAFDRHMRPGKTNR